MKEKKYTDLQLSYLAGIIDSCGSMYISLIHAKSKTHLPHYQTKLEISNTDENLINWLSNTFGGKKYEYIPKPSIKNARKKLYRWILTNEILLLCSKVLPFLISKKRQCEIMIEMRKTYIKINTNSIKGKYGFQSLEGNIMESRKVLFEELRSLHLVNREKLKIN